MNKGPFELFFDMHKLCMVRPLALAPVPILVPNECVGVFSKIKTSLFQCGLLLGDTRRTLGMGMFNVEERRLQ